MEWITIILSSLITLVSPVGLVVDQVAEGLIRERIHQADLIDVRVDNVPNFQIANGRLDRVRLAGRGVYPVPELRIDTIDVETDPIDVNLGALQAGRLVLDEPVQIATRVVLKTEDLNTLLRSPRVQTLLDDLRFNLPGASEREKNRYGLSHPQIEFLPGNRLRLNVNLDDRVTEESAETVLECGFEVVEGHRLVLLEPTIVIDDQPVPRQLIQTFIDGISPGLTLKQLEEVKVTARVLQFELQPEALDLVVFVRIAPDSPLITQFEQN